MTPAEGAANPAQQKREALETQLELIAHMSQDFASSLDIDATLRNALERITRYVGAEGGAIFLLSDSGEEIVCHACHGPFDLTGLRLGSNEGIVGRSVRNNACQMVRDALNDPGFESRIDAATGFKTRSVLCAPLTVQDRCLGAIELVNKTARDSLFETPDLHLLRAMASSAALALANARFAANLAEQERQRGELELAAEIQRGLLPEQRPAPFPVAGVNLPARLVSGDFFDFLVLDGGRIGFAVGDVSGKGVQAALLMAKTASLYRCLAKSDASPGRLLGIINQEICDTATRGMFVTMIAGVYDPARGCIRLANAGHEPPLLHGEGGSFQRFPAREPPVGISPTVVGEGQFPEEEIALNKGTLYIFTDGITEARTADGAQCGVEGLKKLIAGAAHLQLSERLNAIAAHVNQHPLRDDVTVLAVDGSSASAPRTAPTMREGSEERRLLMLSFRAQADQLKSVRTAVQDAVTRAGCGATCTKDIVLAVDEACQNIIRHAYRGIPGGTIVLEIERQDDVLVFWLRDFAPKVDVGKVKPRDLGDVRPGGIGVHLIREAMDECGFVPCPSEGNIFRMAKRIH